MKKRKKQDLIVAGIALTGILLILIVLWTMRGEYWFSSYTNSEHSFSIKYPSNWSYQEDKNGAAVIIYTPLENDLDVFPESVNVVIQDISDNPMSLKDYSNLAIEQLVAVFEDKLTIIESEQVFFAMKSGYKFVFAGESPEGPVQYMSQWVIDGTTVYQVTYTTYASQYERYLPKVKRMFRSFRITSKSAQ